MRLRPGRSDEFARRLSERRQSDARARRSVDGALEQEAAARGQGAIASAPAATRTRADRPPTGERRRRSDGRVFIFRV